MVISKKGKRKIKVNENVFYWSANFGTDILRLTIMTDEKSFSRLICEFNYKNRWLYFKEGKGDTWILTPHIVRQSIDYGISEGWSPFEKGRDLFIENMEKILNLTSERN